jgi:hypothetical protein
MFPNTKIENKCASIRNLGGGVGERGGELGRVKEDLKNWSPINES